MPDSPVLTAFTADSWESALPRLRFLEPAQELGLEVLRGNQGDQVWPERVSAGDLVLIQRDFPRFRQAASEVIRLARAEGKPVIYETDDLQLELPEGHVARAELRDYLLPIFSAIAQADLVTCSTAPLCERLRALNPNVVLLPNYLPDRLWSFKSAGEPGEDGPVVIGYMGGGTHQADLEMIAPALQQLGETYQDRLRFRFWGGRPPESLLQLPRTEWIPLDERDYAAFARFFGAQSCDIFLGPLQDTFFNRCKSAIKFLECSTLAVPGVWSRIEPYAGLVRQGENGFLAGSLEEWQAHLQRLIEDAELRARLGLAAQDTVRSDWLLSQHAGRWLEAYRQALSVSQQPRETPEAVQIALHVFEQVESRHSELGRDIAVMQEQIRELAPLREQAGQLKTLQAKANQLDDILESRTWKLARLLQRLKP